MITLKKLSEISSNSEQQRKLSLNKLSQEKLEKYDMIYHGMIDGLESKLEKAAISGQKRYTVGVFSAYTDIIPNLKRELHDKYKSNSNLYCALRDKAITINDVIENLDGNFKRVYDYLNQNELNPQILYWSDGGGMDEGFKIEIKW